MGAQNGTGSSASSGGGGNNNNNNNNNQATQMAQNVKKKLGLVEKKYGPMSYLQSGPTTGYYASAYAGTPDADFYGEEASQFAKEEMQAAGMGTITPQGSFQNVVKGKDGKMQIVSGAGAMMGTGMGTGEQTVMGQVPISQAMFEQQKKLQMIASGALALTGVPLMGAAFMDYNSKKYSDYVNKFNNTLQSSTSIAAQPTTQTQSNQRITDTKATAETGESSFVETEAERAKRMAAISRRSEALKGKRSFFSGVKQTIAGQL